MIDISKVTRNRGGDAVRELGLMDTQTDWKIAGVAKCSDGSWRQFYWRADGAAVFDGRESPFDLVEDAVNDAIRAEKPAPCARVTAGRFIASATGGVVFYDHSGWVDDMPTAAFSSRSEFAAWLAANLERNKR